MTVTGALHALGLPRSTGEVGFLSLGPTVPPRPPVVGRLAVTPIPRQWAASRRQQAERARWPEQRADSATWRTESEAQGSSRIFADPHEGPVHSVGSNPYPGLALRNPLQMSRCPPFPELT